MTGVASVDVGAKASLNPASLNLAADAAKVSAAGDADIERHFAIGMQQTAAQFAAARLSQDGSDPSGAAASLESSEERFRTLVAQLAASQIVVSSQPDAASASDGDAGSEAAAGGGPSATPSQVREAYADA